MPNMQARSRQYIFFVFLGLFVVAAPAIVLYTAGYRYSFAHHRILQTGLLLVETVPRGAHIFLDKQQMRERTPAVVDEVLPGTHILRLQKEGFLPWQKDVEVRSRETTFWKDVVLFADAPSVLTRLTQDPRARQTEPDAHVLETIRIRTTGDQVSVFQHTQEGARLLALVPRGSYRVLASALPQTVLIQNEHTQHISLIETTGADRPILLSAKALFWEWGPLQNPQLLHSDGFEISVYDRSTQNDQTLTRVSSPITGLAWHPAGSAVLYTQQTGLFAIETDERNARNLTLLAQGADFRDVSMDARGQNVFFFGRVEDKRGWFTRRLVD